jgi:carbonic anhydrase
MSLINDILQHNSEFVENKEYEAFLTDGYPDKKLVIVTCMDTRLVELLPRAMGVRNGDVKMIKTAGAVVTHPFGSAMRSIMIAIYSLGAEEITVVGHHGCGMTGLSAGPILNKAVERGVPHQTLTVLRQAGVDLDKWLEGFDSVAEGVLASVNLIRSHPLLPKDVPVHGMIMDSATGALEWVANGYTAAKK